MSWNAIAQDPEYKTWSAAKKSAVKQRYFQTQIQPELRPEQYQEGWQKFLKATEGVERKAKEQAGAYKEGERYIDDKGTVASYTKDGWKEHDAEYDVDHEWMTLSNIKEAALSTSPVTAPFYAGYKLLQGESPAPDFQPTKVERFRQTRPTKRTAKNFRPKVRYKDWLKGTSPQAGMEETITHPASLALGSAMGVGMTMALRPGMPAAQMGIREAASQMTFGLSDLGIGLGGGVKNAIGRFRPDMADVPPGAWSDLLKVIEADELAFQSLGKKKLTKKLMSYFVDRSGNVKGTLNSKGEIGQQARMRLEEVFGSNAKANAEFSDAAKKIFDGLDSENQRYLDAVIRARRTKTIEAYKDGMKHGGIEEGQSAAALDNLKALNPELHENLTSRANEYFNTMRRYLGKLKEEGMITQETFDSLMVYDYSPRKFIQHFDPEIPAMDWKGKPISIHNSGIRALNEGSDQAMVNDSRMLLAETIQRVEGRIVRNNANKALFNLATEQPENGLARVISNEADVLPGEELVEFFTQGIKKQLALPKDIAAEWLAYDPQVSQVLGNVAMHISGSSILKPMATGYNPEFAIMNLARDMGHALLTIDEYSSFMPRAGWQFLGDMKSTFKDAWMRKGVFKEFLEEGGMRELKTHMGKIGKSKYIKPIVEKIPGGQKAISGMKGLGKFLSHINETSEVWTRLAVRRRALINMQKAGGVVDSRKATNIAANLIDFSQGGSLTKAIDKAVPYLNAGVQGTRTVVRAARKDPARFLWMSSQIGAMSFALRMYNHYKNPEVIADTPTGISNGYWVMPFGDSYIDKNGDTIWSSVRIAKDHGQRAIASLFEGMADMLYQHLHDQPIKFNWEQSFHGVQDLAGVSLDQLMPPTFKMVAGVKANYDFFRRQNIWKGRDVIPEAEATPYTHDAFKALGKATGWSPERTKFALQQLFTTGNIYTDMFSLGVQPFFKGLPKEERSMMTKEMVTKIPFLRKMTIRTYPRQKYKTALDEAKREENTVSLRNRYALTRHIKGYYNLPTEQKRKELYKFVKTLPRRQQRNAIREFRMYSVQKEIKNRGTLMRIKGFGPETRARTFVKMMKTMPESQREQIIRDSRKIPGFWSRDFAREYQLIKAGR